MKRLSKDQRRFLTLNLLLLFGVLAYLLYYHISMHSAIAFSHCFLRNWFGIYCPLCGGTRSLYELSRFHLLAALRYNAYVVFAAALFLVWEVATLIRFLRGRKTFYRIPKWVYLALAVLLILFFALRAILLVAYGIDWIGDLL